MPDVHFMAAGQTITSCGIDSLAQGEMHSSPHKIITSCPECKSSIEFGQARQRLPAVPPRPHYETIARGR